MKITIFGSYNKNSIGDKAILLSLLHLLFENATIDLKVDLITFEDSSIKHEMEPYHWFEHVHIKKFLPYKLPNIVQPQTKENNKDGFIFFLKGMIPIKCKEWIKNLLNMKYVWNNFPINIVDSSDTLIIGGGNLLMDLYPAWPIRPYLIAKQFYKARKPIYIIGVGAMPVNTLIGNFFLQKLCKLANVIYTRDKQSQGFILKKWKVNAKVHPDLAISYPYIQNLPLKNESFIAINVVPLYSKNWPYTDPAKYDYYINSIAINIHQCWKENNDIYLKFFDTNYPTDREASLLLISKLKELGVWEDHIFYEDRLFHSKEIIELITGAKAALVTRLHAGILAVKAGVPILAISYQPKVAGVLEIFGLENSIVHFENIGTLKERFEMLFKSPSGYRLSDIEREELNLQNISIVKNLMNEMKDSFQGDEKITN